MTTQKLVVLVLAHHQRQLARAPPETLSLFFNPQFFVE